MKLKKQYSLLLLGVLALASCKKDNYDEPSSQLTARLVYQGQPLGFENYQVAFELYQSGFGKVGPMGSSFTQDGVLEQKLFNGNYKLIVPNGQGPFVWPKTATGAPDSMAITMNGNQTMDIEVTPYFMIRNLNITGSASAASATFNLEQVATGVDAKSVAEVAIFVNKTQFVANAGDYKLREQKRPASDFPGLTNIALTAEVPSITPSQNYMYVRVGVRIDGVEDWLYSEVKKIEY